jgi:hypothetical protein
VIVSPADGAQVDTDTPTLVVRNAAPGFEAGQATYVFHITSRTGVREVMTFSAPAGNGTTSATVPSPLPRGMLLRWQVTAQNAGGEQVSSFSTFHLPAVDCKSSSSPYAKHWVDWYVPPCSLAENSYNDPDDTLGRPDACCRRGPPFTGFLSLGDGGWIDEDMVSCAENLRGTDIRVWQSVSSEPVTVYAGGSPTGPWIKLRTVRNCGQPSDTEFSNFCEFDLSEAEIDVARYFRVEDGEKTPCDQAGTDSEGADIDAVELLHKTP